MLHGRTTLSKFIIEEQRKLEGGAELIALVNDIQTACKYIAVAVAKGPLAGTRGSTGNINVQGEEQKPLDMISNDIMLKCCEWGGYLAGMASEEMDEPYAIPDIYPRGRYLLVFDPLDGSSNIDVNVSIGTIFGIYRCVDEHQRGRAADALQPGKELVAAGYVLYGASTMLVYSTGDGVHGFTLNPEYGEFLLSHPHLTLPDPPAYYSVNASYYNRWSPGVQRFIDWLQGIGEAPPTLSARYIGSLVADFHRNLLRGGIFCYPAENMRDEGKLRLLYEAAPLAFLIEQANGYASNGRQSILELVPEQLHQRTALFIGNRWLVERLEEFIRQEDGHGVHFD